MSSEFDVIVIGAGQAGLAAAYYLKKQGLSFVCLEQGDEIGGSWRSRYDSLTLFTPRWYSSLPGLPLQGDPNGYPTKDEIADYLQAYANAFLLPVLLTMQVQELKKTGDRYTVQTNRGLFSTKSVIVSTGPFQKPIIPAFAEKLPTDIIQLHTSAYTNPAQLRKGPVLIVGAGNSGAQIAVELADSRDVYLSVGHRIKFLPLQFAGRSIFGWLKKLGMLQAHRRTVIGSWFRRQKDPVFGMELRKLVRKGSVTTKPRTVGISGDSICFADHTDVRVSNVVWATGFSSDYSWLAIPGALDSSGRPLHDRGVSPVTGLCFLGLPWQHTRGSALIGGVGEDASYVVSRIIHMEANPKTLRIESEGLNPGVTSK
ncbi:MULTISPECIES: NAD(P)/FAD-dependent oxidoreductase [unclassified Paenibacillus]|uniref:flavin-containing monooxygenase n=1 Tax=unclassified Paenibacillus TaxID=185978 RepID=UPI001AEA61D0|nr:MULTISPECIES: NAD(P)/FAD-dependent oxidoreductase [unclassified Paenibacillus]MBP1153389.1 putative flavoprotein involved in K+ transport [Paenibacillus sp. PvP091]MBP1171228.1 putative flavoprotein involved in K+ transport [Paenibacillus sp. PvR098]MBP2442256.1 putative flavoprotein involved in K+ transport [Paenibacillus sp. PvP052]